MLVMPPSLTPEFGCSKSCYHEQATEDGSPLYRTDEFRMYCFKVLPCSKRFVHDWTVCPFAHPGEKAKRRDPRITSYTGVACPDMKKCQRGDSCPYAHNVFEYWLHPSRYRTQLCNDGIGCKRKVCFFAHTLDELRVSNVKLLPSDLAADGGGFELDPFRPASRSGPKAGAGVGAPSASAAAPGTEALVEALRAQQQQQAKKAAAALQRTASRGLAAELQQLQALQQLQSVLANSQGLGAMQQQVPMESLVGALMAQLRVGGPQGQQPGPQPLGAGAGGGSLLDAVVQQAVQQALANNAAQQAATMLLYQQQQQQQAAVVAAAQQQQNQHAAQAHALLEHLLQQQAAAHAAHQSVHTHQGNGAPPQPSAQAMQAALAMLQHQQQQQTGHMGGMAYAGPQSAGLMQGPIASGAELQHQAHMGAPPPHMGAVGRSSSQNGSLAESVRSSANGMAVNGPLAPTSSSSSGAPTTGAGAATEPIAVAAAPSPPRSLAAPSPAGSPPGETALSSAISGNAAAAALSAAATAASYYSQEASRSSFESYRSSEVELGMQLASGHHSSGPNSGGRNSLELVHQPHQQQQFHPSKFMQDMYAGAAAPGSAAEEALRMQEARHRQLLMAAAAHAANGGMPAAGGVAGQQYPGPFSM
ncbi:Zinc finger CCCH domain-containing protein 30 [Tetrabaena socialis]|uniref:Zinc finger CCCH domain-containing protein 30 n=1 Tax=Tetrabaena socialis TaxID=47790 RepID=A0A2J8AIF5_9CHLO|nr:Zinc finger CCCH domain-containing protein 30 [Tetrabaena socialis]|eukprot:PNH12291.1 Zinc finger CCCH domain-containing protein 30 [Tetrabaena socialis]